MQILCYLVLVFTGWTVATVQPKSVNLALETVLQFDKKNHVADLEVITRVQKFLDNIKNVMSVHDTSRRSNNEVTELKFTDFILEVVNIVKSFNDSDLKQVFTILDDESRKYNYKGCKFYELIDNRDMRRFMSRNLEDAKEIPLEELRHLLDVVASGIEKQQYKRKEKILVSLINSLYSGSEKRLTQVLSNLNNYGTRRSSSRPNLRDIVSKGLKSVIFDFYSNLNPNARQSLKSAVHAYWRHFIGRKERHANVHATKKDEILGPKFIDMTRYYNSDMHKWSAGAKRNKHSTTPGLLIDEKLNTEVELHKPESLDLTVDINSLKPGFQTFLNKIAFSAANKKKVIDDKVRIKETDKKLKTKQKNVKHLKHETIKSFIEETSLLDSLEPSETYTGRVNSVTKIIQYDEYRTTTKKNRGKKSRNKERIRLDKFVKKKPDIDSEIRDLNEIQKKYDWLRKIQSNLSPELKSDKEIVIEKEPSGLEFLVGGQKIQGMQEVQPTLTKRKRKSSKTIPEKRAEANIVSDHQAVIEVTELKERIPKKRLRTPHKTAKKPKKHRKPHISKIPTVNLRAKKKALREIPRKSFAHLSNEGMSIESFENKNTRSFIRRNEDGNEETVTESSRTQSENDCKVVSILHKLEKELENVKAHIKLDASLSTATPNNRSITDILPTEDIPFWSKSKSANTETTIGTSLKVVSQEIDNARRDVKPFNDKYNKITSERRKNEKLNGIARVTTKRVSKYLRDTFFQSNNVTYNSKYVSPLQVLLNQTMERISSYINESIGANRNNGNAKDTDSDISDDVSNSYERTEAVTTTTRKEVTKVSKASQEVSFEEGRNKTTSKEHPKSGLSLEEGENKTVSKEKVNKGSQSLEDSDKITGTKERLQNDSQSLEKRETSTVSKEILKKETQSKEEIIVRAMSKENVKNETRLGNGSQSSQEGEHRTEPKEKVKKGSQSSEEHENTTISKEKVEKPSSEEDEKGTLSEESLNEGSLLLRDKNDSKSHDNKIEPDRLKTEITQSVGNVSLSTNINKTADYGDARKDIRIVKDASIINKSGMILPEADSALNDLVEDPLKVYN